MFGVEHKCKVVYFFSRKGLIPHCGAETKFKALTLSPAVTGPSLHRYLILVSLGFNLYKMGGIVLTL